MFAQSAVVWAGLVFDRGVHGGVDVYNSIMHVPCHTPCVCPPGLIVKRVCFAQFQVASMAGLSIAWLLLRGREGRMH